MQNRINIKEFADRLGVSTATVSRAFGTKGRISHKTRAMILKNAEVLGYRANIHARHLSSGASDTIAFFYPSLVRGEPDYFVSEIMLGISETAAKANLPLQIHPLHDSQEQHMDFYRDMILNGTMSGLIVLYGSENSGELIATARTGGIPYIVIGPMPEERRYIVSYQIRHGAELAGRYFRNIGRKKVAFVGGINDAEKRSGFADGLGCNKWELFFDRGGSTFKDGAVAFERLLSDFPDVDSVFCANDILAIGFIRAAFEKGLKVPDDIAVIGCDDVKIARFYCPALTTIRFHEYEVGQSAVTLLQRIIEGDEDVHGQTIECELIVRESA